KAMPARRIRSPLSLPAKSAQLALAVPQVMAHRIRRLAVAGLSPSNRDLREFQLMVTEKHAAFLASWNAMTIEAFRVQQAFMLSWLRGIWMPWPGPKITAASIVRQMQNAALGIALSGMAPIRRTAVANSRRLAAQAR